MRRLLYLALVLVFLAITGLAFVRVTESPAYVARSRVMRIHPGMTRGNVQASMADLRRVELSSLNTYDYWQFESNYVVVVWYNRAHESEATDLENEFVRYVDVSKCDPPTLLDWLLESLGYPRAPCFQF